MHHIMFYSTDNGHPCLPETQCVRTLFYFTEYGHPCVHLEYTVYLLCFTPLIMDILVYQEHSV